MTVVTVPARFCGPPTSANGGYACGLVADHVDAQVVEVTLRRPPPLDTPLAVERAGAGVQAVDGTLLIAEARPTILDLPVLPPPSVEQLDDADPVPDGWASEHPFPTCFTCGPERAAGDGLHLSPRRIPEGLSPRFATTWTPDGSLARSDGSVPPVIVWAALDCPSCFPFLTAESTPPMVLGRLTAELIAPVVAGEEHVVTSWALGDEGRKRFGASAIFRGRDLVARAQATWIVVASHPPETST